MHARRTEPCNLQLLTDSSITRNLSSSCSDENRTKLQRQTSDSSCMLCNACRSQDKISGVFHFATVSTNPMLIDSKYTCR